MAIELIVRLDDDTTEEEQKAIALGLCMLSTVIGVYRPTVAAPPGVTVTHDAPRATQ